MWVVGGTRAQHDREVGGARRQARPQMATSLPADYQAAARAASPLPATALAALPLQPSCCCCSHHRAELAPQRFRHCRRRRGQATATAITLPPLPRRDGSIASRLGSGFDEKGPKNMSFEPV